MKIFIALLKREILEHKNIWKVPVILLIIAILVKLSLSMGNLTVDIDVPKQLNLDELKDTLFNGVIAKTLGILNFMVMVVMVLVSAFYSLSCLYNERQDESVLFWRSLPISDTITVASKLFVALIIIPILIVICQAIIACIFFFGDALAYMQVYFSESIPFLGILLIWTLLPMTAWCMVCSGVAKKNPFLLAFVAPVIFIVVDKLFMNGFISQNLIINRVTGINNVSWMSLVWGIVFSAICITLTVSKRSQRI